MSIKFYIQPNISNELLRKVDLELALHCGYQKTITSKYILYESYSLDDSDNLTYFNKIIKDNLGLYIKIIDLSKITCN